MKKSLIALTALTLSTGILGCSRGVEDIYTFQYHGQTAIIKRDNQILRSDDNWIQIGNDKIYHGTITSDNNNIITIYNKKIRMNLFNPFGAYNIKDNKTN